MKKIILQTTMLSVMLFFSLVGMDNGSDEIIELVRSQEFVAYGLGDIRLFKDAQGFHVFKDGIIYDVKDCFCNTKDELTQLVLNMSNYELKQFLGRGKPQMIKITPEEFSKLDIVEMVEVTGEDKTTLLNQLFASSNGYIEVKQVSYGEYVMHAQSRILGGGKDKDDSTKFAIGLVVVGVATGGIGFLLIGGAFLVYKLIESRESRQTRYYYDDPTPQYSRPANAPAPASSGNNNHRVASEPAPTNQHDSDTPNPAPTQTQGSITINFDIPKDA